MTASARVDSAELRPIGKVSVGDRFYRPDLDVEGTVLAHSAAGADVFVGRGQARTFKGGLKPVRAERTIWSSDVPVIPLPVSGPA